LNLNVPKPSFVHAGTGSSLGFRSGTPTNQAATSQHSKFIVPEVDHLDGDQRDTYQDWNMDEGNDRGKYYPFSSFLHTLIFLVRI
jgi:hypothetical protein